MGEADRAGIVHRLPPGMQEGELLPHNSARCPLQHVQERNPGVCS